MICKRLFDIIASTILLITLLPLILLIVIAVKFESKGPALFKQDRVGLNGKIFVIFKFRSMLDGAINMGSGICVVEKDPRITRVGSILRKLSLDELPQLLNVLKGEMSLVGPRPTLPYQVERYDEKQRLRLLMKPGITGWAQVNGRNKLTWPEKISLDIWYVENWTLWLDMKILLKTILVVFAKDVIYNNGKGDEISRVTVNKSNELGM